MFQSFLSKYAAVFGIVLISTPLELVKMRMTTNKELHQVGKIGQQYTSLRNCFKTILHDQGALAFWKGSSIILGRILPIESMNYYARKNLQKIFKNTLINNVLIAIASGIAAVTIIYPTDILRQLMNNNTKSRLSIIDALKEIKSLHGYRYFYKGYPNVLLTLSIYRGAYNGSYDTHKSYARNLKEKAIIAYFCTIFADCVTYPVEIVRRRRICIDAKENFFKYGKQIWCQEGLKGFYKGASLIPIQSVSWAVLLMVFDTAGLHFQTVVQI